MDLIQHHKRQARLRAAANGTSHQKELNAIARENGYVAWGDFARALTPQAKPDQKDDGPQRLTLKDFLNDGMNSPMNDFLVSSVAMTEEERILDSELERQRYNMRPIEYPALELSDLIDAFRKARQSEGHLVVLRPTPEREEKVIELLWEHQNENPHDKRLDGLAFAYLLDAGNVAIQAANAHGHTLISGSGNMERNVQHGLFIVHSAQQKLMQINRLYSKRDIDLIYSV